MKPSPPNSDNAPPDGRASRDHVFRGIREASPYMSLGAQLAFSMVFYVGAGYLLDRWLGTAPWLLTAGAVLGMAAIFYQLFRFVRQMNAESTARRQRRPPDDPPDAPPFSDGSI